MKVLIDTHILLWWLDGDIKLPKLAKNIIEREDTEIYFSIVSIWEIEIKRTSNIKNLNFDGKRILELCEKTKLNPLKLQFEHLFELRNLRRSDDAPRHKDPFDRRLICQAISERMFFLTHDKLLSDYQCGNVVCV